MNGAMIRLLMLMGVLLCSMHFAEPVSAHSADSAFHLVSDGGEPEQPETGEAVHGGHHHCPVAPDLRQTGTETGTHLIRERLFAAIMSPLTSRAPPPLLDPPLA